MGATEQKVMMAAYTVALSAQVGELDALDVEALVSQARDGLPEGDQLGHAITAFATAYELVRRDAERLAEAGEELSRAVVRASQPVLRDAGRADIHG